MAELYTTSSHTRSTSIARARRALASIASVASKAARLLLIPLLVDITAAILGAWTACHRITLLTLGRDQGIFQYVAWAVSVGERATTPPYGTSTAPSSTPSTCFFLDPGRRRTNGVFAFSTSPSRALIAFFVDRGVPPGSRAKGPRARRGGGIAARRTGSNAWPAWAFATPGSRPGGSVPPLSLLGPRPTRELLRLVRPRGDGASSSWPSPRITASARNLAPWQRGLWNRKTRLVALGGVGGRERSCPGSANRRYVLFTVDPRASTLLVGAPENPLTNLEKLKLARRAWHFGLCGVGGALGALTQIFVPCCAMGISGRLVPVSIARRRSDDVPLYLAQRRRQEILAQGNSTTIGGGGSGS